MLRKNTNLKRFIKRFVDYVQGLPTYVLKIIPALAFILLLYLEMRIMELQNRESFNILDMLIVSLAFYIGGCIGLVTIIRQEVELPLGHKLRGTLAIVIGTIQLLMGWSIATLFLVLGLS